MTEHRNLTWAPTHKYQGIVTPAVTHTYMCRIYSTYTQNNYYLYRFEWRHPNLAKSKIFNVQPICGTILPNEIQVWTDQYIYFNYYVVVSLA